MTINDHQKSVAAACLRAAHHDELSFPAIVERLIEAGFESYAIDFRRQTATYYTPGGDSVELPAEADDTPIAPSFHVGAIVEAIREAQSGKATYSYRGFCRKVRTAGCAGYVVSFSGRRAVYFGRTAETHVEHFPR